MTSIPWPRPRGSVFSFPNLVLFYVLLVLCFQIFAPAASAQVERPTNQFIFLSDSNRFQQQQSDRRKKILKPIRKSTDDIDFQAPQVEFDRETSELVGTGGVTIVTPELIAESDSARYRSEEKSAELEGNVVISRPEGQLLAEQADFDLETETGSFTNSKFTFDDGNYLVEARQTKKLSEYDYELDGSSFTTCSCSDGTKPWSLNCGESTIRDGGFAQGYNTTVKMWDVPVFYTPYIAFPVVRERTSGLLFPQYGADNQNGVQLSLPYYAVIDDSSDMTIRPFVETETRYGVSLDYRRAVSERHSIEGRLLYSNERLRDGELRGTNIDGVFDSDIEDDRIGVHYEQFWSSPSDWTVPMSFVSDISYVGDDLLLREIEDPDIGLRNSRFTSSRAALRLGLGDSTSAEIGAEYNQALQADDDLTFQRLPELSLDHSSTYRPFGFNPLGLKLRARGAATLTRFDRDEGFDGMRLDLYPRVSVPFRWKNYLRNELELGYRFTAYDLDDRIDPGDGSELDSSSDRGLFTFNYQTSTGVEKIYELEDDSGLARLLRFGEKNQDYSLKRLRHLIEPRVSFSYIPDEDQSDLPVFDSIDRIRPRTLFSYGVRQSLFGSFRRTTALKEEIDELAPLAEDLPVISGAGEFDRLNMGGEFVTPGAQSSGRGRQTRELAYVELLQNFDYREEQDDNDPNRRALSDLAFNVGAFPTADLGLEFESDIGLEGGGFSAWRFGGHFDTDRGDRLRLRYSFVDDALSQIEGNLEFVLGPRLGFGYYGRFDEEESEFIENIVALRLRSACDCWSLDLGYSDQINPDRQRVLMSFTFRGIGDIAQDFGVFANQQQQN